jgi:hypothetical protein
MRSAEPDNNKYFPFPFHKNQIVVGKPPMWIHQSLYEKLPALYVLLAVLTVTTLGAKGISGFSAALLVAAALRIHTWRRAYRQG